MDLKTEEKLIKEAKYSIDAFSKLYRVYYPKIYRYALRRTTNVPTALDVTSTVFFKAFKYINNYEWRDLPFSSWLYKIAGNEINDHFSSKKNKSVSLEILFEQSGFEPASLENLENQILEAEEKLQNHQTFLTVQQEILTLDAIYQEVITLKYFEEKKIKEIALILGRSEGTIKSQLSRGLEKLRFALNSNDEKNKISSSTQPFVKP